MSGDCVQSISEKCLCGSLCAKNTNEARTPLPLGHYRGGRKWNKILRLQGHTRTHIYKRVAFFFVQGTNFMSLAKATWSKNTPYVTRYLKGLHQWKVWRFAGTKTSPSLCRSVSVEFSLKSHWILPKFLTTEAGSQLHPPLAAQLTPISTHSLSLPQTRTIHLFPWGFEWLNLLILRSEPSPPPFLTQWWCNYWPKCHCFS